MKEECGVVPTVPWPAEERGGGVGGLMWWWLLCCGVEKEGGGEGGESGSIYKRSRGASKKMSRYVVFAMMRSKGAFPVATIVMGPGMVAVPL